VLGVPFVAGVELRHRLESFADVSQILQFLIIGMSVIQQKIKRGNYDRLAIVCTDIHA
jgi:hypothetical protein